MAGGVGPREPDVGKTEGARTLLLEGLIAELKAFLYIEGLSAKIRISRE